MSSLIRVCRVWQEAHERPHYTMGETCPGCGADTRPAAPARFSPEDPYGSYRRRTRRRARE